MLLEKREIQALSIVLIGHFNPVIFHPFWLAKNGLIANVEAESAEVQIIHQDLAVYKISWFNFELTRERFHINTLNEAYFEPLRDLVVGIFEILAETPVTQMGINFEYHVPLPSKADLTNFLNNLSPSSFWKKVFDQPSFNTISIQQSRTTFPFGFVDLLVAPSGRVSNGIFFRINNHYEFPANKENVSNGCRESITFLNANWKNTADDSKILVEKIWAART